MLYVSNHLNEDGDREMRLVCTGCNAREVVVGSVLMTQENLDEWRAAVESRGRVAGLREAAEVARQCAADYDSDRAEDRTLDAESEAACNEARAIAARLDAMAQAGGS